VKVALSANCKHQPVLTSPKSGKRCASVGLHGGAFFPPSALRQGKFGTRQPLGIGIVHEVFGEKVTLYQVLGISPLAQPAEVRKAYLYRAKKELLNAGISIDGESTSCELFEVSDAARKQFQAISRAYEILSKPDMRIEYDMYLYGHVSVPSLSSSTGGSVAWSPCVERRCSHDEQRYEKSRLNDHSHTPELRDERKRQQSVQGRSNQQNSKVVLPPRSVSLVDYIYNGTVGSCILGDEICCIPSLESCSTRSFK
jgi:hypothetical protein